jgi:preprotein translocase subunit Sss1
MQAKFLCTIWIAQFALSIFGIRQLSALVTMPRSTDVNTNSLEKRDTDDVPVDIQFTQKWLSKILGDSNNPDFAFILLVVWISLCILTSGIIYNMIIEKVENPSTEEEKDGKWSQAIKMYSIRVWKGIKSFLVASARVLLMDRHPSWSTFTAGFGWWTVLRIGISVVQLLVILSVTRHVIATASLIADPENPYPSGLELKLTLPMIKDAMPTMSESPDMTMLLMVIVLSGIIIIGMTGWHALLHPRATAPQTSKMIGTMIHGSGSGYQAMVAVIAIVLVLSFSACLVFFVQIMQSVTELDFIKNGGYGDNVGLVGGLLIFAIFVPPLAWVCMEVWDILCTRFRRSGTPAAQRSDT